MADCEIELILHINSWDVSPDELTKLTGLSPDKLRWQVPEIEDPSVSKTNRFQIVSPASPENSTVQEQWEALRERILPAIERIQKLPETARRQLSLNVLANKYIPVLEVPPETMREIADFGVPLEISIYGAIVEEDEP